MAKLTAQELIDAIKEMTAQVQQRKRRPSSTLS